MIYLWIIIMLLIIFGVARFIFLRIRNICRLFKNNRRREGWRAIFRIILLLAVVGAGIYFIKVIAFIGVAIIVFAIMSGNRNTDYPYHYDDYYW